MDQSEMLRKVEAHYHTFWNGPAALIDEQISSDFVDETAPPGAEPGSGQVKQGSAIARSAFPDMVVTVEDSVVGDNVIAPRAPTTRNAVTRDRPLGRGGVQNPSDRRVRASAALRDNTPYCGTACTITF